MLIFDHIAIGAESLETGVAVAEAALGTELAQGGRHPAMGTWNRLLSLGPGEYLEVIAIEPGAKPPDQPRWFDLDRFDGLPRPAAWIARVPDLRAALAAAPLGTGVPWALERGDLRWSMAVPEDGRLPFDGLFPALIEWTGPAHPANRLPDRGHRLVRLTLASPDANGLYDALEPICSDPRIEIVEAEAPRITATIDTPKGPATL
ncbi:VOC family protein [Rhodobacterales bacterium HKCCE3408]|nr:VOC family protein [Rhodobacterales bacterium HKCCE3408]